MRTTRSLIAASAIGLAAAVAAGPAIAAPADNVSHAAPAKAKAKAKAKANAKVLKQLRTQNRAYAVWRTRVVACSKANSAAPADLRARAKRTATANAKLRATALRRVNAKQPTAALTAKRVQLGKATKNLAVVARLCAAAGVKAPSTAPTPIQIAPSGTPGTPAAPIVVQVPGGTAQAQPVELSLRNVLGGTPIDLSPLIGADGVLPSTLTLVGLDQLLGGVLGEGGLIGVDVQTLLNLVNAGVKDLTSCGLLDLGCIGNSLLGTVDTAVTGVTGVLNGTLGGQVGDLSSLLKIERLSDTVIRLVPVGPLAELLNGVGGVDALLGGVTGGADGLLGGLIRL